jgi:hypothetical protein
MGRVLRLTMLGLLVGGLLAVSGTARTTGVGGTPAPAAFRLADGSAGCAFDGERLACRSAASPTAVVLEADGSSQPTDTAVAWDEDTPVLWQTESWWHGGFSCRVVDAVLVCASGRGSISVAPDGVGGASSTVGTAP